MSARGDVLARLADAVDAVVANDDPLAPRLRLPTASQPSKPSTA
jgi:hypothetical protein